jgi:phage terminase small subunit
MTKEAEDILLRLKKLLERDRALCKVTYKNMKGPKAKDAPEMLDSMLMTIDRGRKYVNAELRNLESTERKEEAQERAVKEEKEPKVSDLVAALETEMKRYRKAVRMIANEDFTHDPNWARGIAKKALKEPKK